MDYRQFKIGDIVDLDGERATVLARETGGLLRVFAENREETWNAEHCVLAERPASPQ